MMNDYKLPIDLYIEEVANPTASSSTPPYWTSGTAMLWSLSQRLDNSEKQTQELSSQSERQIRLIQVMTQSQSQHEREQREAMAGILTIFEQHDTRISKLEHATKTYRLDQRRTMQDVRVLRDDLVALRDQVQAQQQQQPCQTTVVRNGMRGRGTTAALQAEQSPMNREATRTEPRVTLPFKDVYGRWRKLCRHCGENLGATYCKSHERRRVCLRRRGSGNRRARFGTVSG